MPRHLGWSLHPDGVFQSIPFLPNIYFVPPSASLSLRWTGLIWVATWEHVPFGMRAQRRLWSDCASTQSDQSFLVRMKQLSSLAIQKCGWFSLLLPVKNSYATILILIMLGLMTLPTPNPPHFRVRKYTFRHVRITKLQISLHIRAVWSESSLGAFWIVKKTMFLYAYNEDSDQTVQVRRLIWVFVWCTNQKVRFLRLQLLWFNFQREQMHFHGVENIYLPSEKGS